MNVFDFVKSINDKHDLGLSQEEIESQYQPWIVNKALSFTPDTLLFANLMNRYSFLPKRVQFQFFMTGIPKGRRYGKWLKKEKPEADIEFLKNHYNINIMRAEEMLDLISPEQLNIIKEMKGGKS